MKNLRVQSDAVSSNQQNVERSSIPLTVEEIRKSKVKGSFTYYTGCIHLQFMNIFRFLKMESKTSEVTVKREMDEEKSSNVKTSESSEVENQQKNPINVRVKLYNWNYIKRRPNGKEVVVAQGKKWFSSLLECRREIFTKFGVILGNVSNSNESSKEKRDKSFVRIIEKYVYVPFSAIDSKLIISKLEDVLNICYAEVLFKLIELKTLQTCYGCLNNKPSLRDHDCVNEHW